MSKKLPPISPEYKKQLRNAVFSIVFFYLIYFILVILSLALAVAIGYLTLQIFSNFNLNFITVLIGGGLAAMAVLILVFIFKFIFSSTKIDTSGLIQIHRNQEPELFKLIDEVVKEVETEQPKKVFLTTDVNAFVNYDSTFWSMFLPVKKNLTIGLGLINTTTVSELKAILAHEFGHFSQKSMKVGSFVNQAQRIIHDMIYNNNAIDKITSNLAAIHGVLDMFSSLAMLVINGIKWVLGKTYDFLFLNHLSLSRQMEFDADAIATFIAGSEVKTASLLRLDLSSLAFDNAFRFYFDKDNSSDTKNLYQNQSTILMYLSEENNHEIQNNLPYIQENEIDRYNKSKLKIEDQWSSHPTIQQRIAAIKKLAVPSENIDNRLAKNIIQNFNKYAESFTEQLFKLSDLKRTGNYTSESEFLYQYKKMVQESTFPKVFNNYYDYKHPVFKDFRKISVEINIQGEINTDVFSDENISLVYEKTALENDSQILEMIANGAYKLKTFDYDGIKYTQKQASKARKILNERLTLITEEIEHIDAQIFRYFYLKSNDEQKNRLLELQENFNNIDAEFDMFQKAFEDFVPHINFMSEVHQIAHIPKLRSNLLDHEKTFKLVVEKLLSSSFAVYVTEEQKKLLQDYIRLKNLYFNKTEYLEAEVKMLNEVLSAYQAILNSAYFKVKKNFLDFKAEILVQN